MTCCQAFPLQIKTLLPTSMQYQTQIHEIFINNVEYIFLSDDFRNKSHEHSRVVTFTGSMTLNCIIHFSTRSRMPGFPSEYKPISQFDAACSLCMPN